MGGPLRLFGRGSRPTKREAAPNAGGTRDLEPRPDGERLCPSGSGDEMGGVEEMLPEFGDVAPAPVVPVKGDGDDGGASDSEVGEKRMGRPTGL